VKYTYAGYQKFCQDKYLSFGTVESLIAYYDGMADFSEKFRASDVALQYRLRESGMIRDAVAEESLACLMEIRDILRLLRAAIKPAPDASEPQDKEPDHGDASL